MDIKSLETKLDQFAELKNTVFKMGKELSVELYQLERDTFDGLTYREFIDKQNQEVKVNDNITIKINTYHINGEYKIDDDIILKIDLTIYADQTGVNSRVIYKSKETKLPQKYQSQYDELLAECLKYKVENPSKKYQDKYGISMY
jgi:outer membrane receptor for Fe3+-dicitrate